MTEETFDVGTNAERLRPSTLRGAGMMLVFAALALLCVYGAVVVSAWLWACALFCVLVMVAMWMQTWSEHAFLDIGDHGFVVSVHTIRGPRVERHCWKDCSEFFVRRTNGNATIVFDHAPKRGTKAGKTATLLLGRTNGIIHVYAMPAAALARLLNERRQAVVGVTRFRR